MEICGLFHFDSVSPPMPLVVGEKFSASCMLFLGMLPVFCVKMAVLYLLTQKCDNFMSSLNGHLFDVQPYLGLLGGSVKMPITTFPYFWHCNFENWYLGTFCEIIDILYLNALSQ